MMVVELEGECTTPRKKGGELFGRGEMFGSLEPPPGNTRSNFNRDPNPNPNPTCKV